MRKSPYADALTNARARFAGREEYEDYAAYLLAKERGLKADAARAAEAFAASLDQAPLEDAIAFARALDAAKRDFDDAPGLIPYPVAMAEARACERWERADPCKAAPVLIRARLLNDSRAR